MYLCIIVDLYSCSSLTMTFNPCSCTCHT